MTIGLIGYGRFGKFAAPHLARKAEVLVFDRTKRYGRFPSRRIQAASLATVAAQPVVVLAVPVSRMRETLLAIAPHVRPDAFVLDVGAVKMLPVLWMRTLLPPSVKILGTHPLFGPDSAAKSLRGHAVVLCPVRVARRLLATVRSHLHAFGLDTLVMTPRQHDRFAAETLVVTQFVGRTIARSGLDRYRKATASYQSLMKIAETADNDTRELFHDMIRFNPFARGAVQKVLRSQKKLLTAFARSVTA